MTAPAIPSTERSRLARERRRAGLRVIPVEVHDDEIERLVIAGLLAPADAKDRWAVGDAVAEVLEQWMERIEPG